MSAQFTFKPVVLSIALVVSSAAYSSILQAQTDNHSQRVLEQKHALNITATALNSAMNQLAQVAGVVLSFDPELTKGKTSNSVQGSYTFEEALTLMLQGSQLAAVKKSGGGYVIKVASSDVMVLDSVKVRDDAINESAYGPVDGYIAQRSATSTKTDTPLIETPQSISVVSRQEMDVRSVKDVGEAVSYSSGVFAGTDGEVRLFGGNNIQIRGFGGDGTLGSSYNEYLDGLKLRGSNYLSSNFDPWLFERVEVLKGPASVLFGQNQPGGVVNMVSKRPHDNMINKVQLGSGNLDKATLAFDVGGDLSDAWQFRITGLGLDGEAQQNHSGRKRLLFAPSLRWSSEKSDLTLLSHYQKDDINASPLNTLPKDAVFANPNGRVSINFRVGESNYEFWDRESWSIGYLFSHQFNDVLTFRQNFRYTNSKQNSNWVFRRALSSDRRTLTRRAWRSEEENTNLTIDSQLQWKFGTERVIHTILAGVDYQDLSGQENARFGAAPSIDIFTPVYNLIIDLPPIFRDRGSDIEQVGIYLQDQIKIGNLSLLIGGRYDDAEISLMDNRRGSNLNESDNDFTSRFGVIYKFSNGIAPYISYAESFEPVSGTDRNGSRFEPTKGRQYEIGIKYQPFDMNYLVTISAFDLTQENVLTEDPVDNNFEVQTGEIQTKGVELEGKFNLSNNLNITASYTYLDDEITESNYGDEGNQRNSIPDQTASFWSNYLFTDGALLGLDVGVGMRYIGGAQGDDNNTFSVPSYTLTDLAVHYDLSKSPLELKNWKASLNVQNLFDKYYIASCSSSRNCYLGLERSIRASVEYSW